MYYIISMKHTQKLDKFITLWGKDNSGYFTSTEGAGLYEAPIEGYHTPPDSFPVEKDVLDKLTIQVEENGIYHCIPNCRAVLDSLGFKITNNGLKLSTRRKA